MGFVPRSAIHDLPISNVSLKLKTMLKLASVLDNLGKPMVQTQDRNSQLLVELGYTGIVIYGTTVLAAVDHAQRSVARSLRRETGH